MNTSTRLVHDQPHTPHRGHASRIECQSVCAVMQMDGVDYVVFIRLVRLHDGITPAFSGLVDAISEQGRTPTESGALRSAQWRTTEQMRLPSKTAITKEFALHP